MLSLVRQVNNEEGGHPGFRHFATVLDQVERQGNAIKFLMEKVVKNTSIAERHKVFVATCGQALGTSFQNLFAGRFEDIALLEGMLVKLYYLRLLRGQMILGMKNRIALSEGNLELIHEEVSHKIVEGDVCACLKTVCAEEELGRHEKESKQHSNSKARRSGWGQDIKGCFGFLLRIHENEPALGGWSTCWNVVIVSTRSSVNMYRSLTLGNRKRHSRRTNK
jgi:hypothetical protein